MKLANRSLVLMTILMLFLILFPMVIGLINITSGDNFQDNDIVQVDGLKAVWAWFPPNQMMSWLLMEMSIFALFVVYQGSRSGQRHFNDRSLASINLSKVIFSARPNVGPFLFVISFQSQPVLMNKRWIEIQFELSPNLRRYKPCARSLD